MKECPIVCSDIQLNLKNRDWAFANVGYGPANPDSPEDFCRFALRNGLPVLRTLRR